MLGLSRRTGDLEDKVARLERGLRWLRDDNESLSRRVVEQEKSMRRLLDLLGQLVVKKEQQ